MSPSLAADAPGLAAFSALQAPGGPLERAADAPPLAAPTLLLDRSAPARVRPLEPADLPAVAGLFLRTFRPRAKRRDRQRALDDVVATMTQLHLAGPCHKTGPGALVHVDSGGAISGFLGFIKTTTLLDGQPLKTCVNSALMAENDGAHQRVGPQLLRAFMACPFDLFLADSANRTSMAFGRPMRFELSLVQSLTWSRPFRPAAMALEAAGQRWPALPRRCLAPLAHLVDRAARPALLRRRRGRAADRHCTVQAIDVGTFARLAPAFLSQFRLRPAWNEAELDWLLANAMRQDARGPLRFYRVTGCAGPVGCFAFYGRGGRSATLLQVLASEGQWDAVVDAVMHAAEALGCAGVRGSGQPEIMPRLYAYPDLILYHSGATMTYSRHREVREAIRTDRVLLGGLLGDRWTRLSAGEFGLGNF